MGHSYIIVGCGVFGLTTALTLSKDPSNSVTLLDRFEPPVPDGSSVDTSRIIRADYADRTYASLALEAQRRWRTDECLRETYHESGMLLYKPVKDDGEAGDGYLEASLATVKSLGLEPQLVHGQDLVRRVTRSPVESDGFKADDELSGYVNPTSGWADSRAGVEVLYRRAKLASNVSFIFERVEDVEYDHDACNETSVQGVRTDTGRIVHGEVTFIATGAWQVPALPVPTTATGQVLAYIALTEEERQLYCDMPVVINFESGWFVIPPDKEGILKVARHAEGYLNTTTVTFPQGSNGTKRFSSDANSMLDTAHPQGNNAIRTLSVPRTSVSHPGQQIPEEASRFLRAGMRPFFPPSIVEREFVNTRVCWYSDTPKGDFLVDWYPKIKNLAVIGGGSGHGYKFLPILGELITDCLFRTNGRVTDSMRRRWSFEAAFEARDGGAKGDGSRGKSERIEWNDL